MSEFDSATRPYYKLLFFAGHTVIKVTDLLFANALVYLLFFPGYLAPILTGVLFNFPAIVLLQRLITVDSEVKKSGADEIDQVVSLGSVKIIFGIVGYLLTLFLLYIVDVQFWKVSLIVSILLLIPSYKPIMNSTVGKIRQLPKAIYYPYLLLDFLARKIQRLWTSKNNHTQ